MVSVTRPNVRRETQARGVYDMETAESEKSTVLRSSFSNKVFSLSGSALDRSVVGAIELADGVWEPHVMKTMARVVQPTDICLDIGANVGVYTMILSELATQGEVHAFEPSAINSKFLTENITRNGLRNARSYPLGLGREEGEQEFHHLVELAGCSFLDPRDRNIVDVLMSSWGVDLERVTELVQIETLDRWFKLKQLPRIDFIKMDVEGSELAVMDSGMEVFNGFRPKLIIEFNKTSLLKYYNVNPSLLFGKIQSIYDYIYLVHDDLSKESSLVNSYAALDQFLTPQHWWADLLCLPQPLDQIPRHSR
jgi:FkbM family methyltransferase